MSSDAVETHRAMSLFSLSPRSLRPGLPHRRSRKKSDSAPTPARDPISARSLEPQKATRASPRHVPASRFGRMLVLAPPRNGSPYVSHILPAQPRHIKERCQGSNVPRLCLPTALGHPQPTHQPLLPLTTQDAFEHIAPPPHRHNHCYAQRAPPLALTTPICPAQPSNPP